MHVMSPTSLQVVPFEALVAKTRTNYLSEEATLAEIYLVLLMYSVWVQLEAAILAA